MSEATFVDRALGRKVGLTDQYLRVWRLILFQQQSKALSMGLDVPPSPPVFNDPTGRQAVPLVQNAAYTIIENDTIFTSELPTGQAPGLQTMAAGLRIHFTVTKGTTPTPNTAEITVYNLAKDTVTSLIREYNYCILQAGYEYGQAGSIFSGTIKMYKTGHESVTDTYLKLYCADGEAGINLGTMNHTYPPGTDPKQKIEDAQKAMQQAGGDVFPGAIDQSAIVVPPNSRPDTIMGMASDHLRDFAQANGAIWYVLDQKFYWAKPSSYQPGEGVNLTAATGLIGYPEMTQDGINVTSLINPAIRIRQLIHIQNEYINQYWTPGGQSGATYYIPGGEMQYYLPVSADGTYVPVSINYEGDSRGQPWYQYMVCLAVDPTSDLLASLLGGFNWSVI
jgi:hypothetical protein